MFRALKKLGSPKDEKVDSRGEASRRRARERRLERKIEDDQEEQPRTAGPAQPGRRPNHESGQQRSSRARRPQSQSPDHDLHRGPYDENPHPDDPPITELNPRHERHIIYSASGDIEGASTSYTVTDTEDISSSDPVRSTVTDTEDISSSDPIRSDEAQLSQNITSMNISGRHDPMKDTEHRRSAERRESDLRKRDQRGDPEPRRYPQGKTSEPQQPQQIWELASNGSLPAGTDAREFNQYLSRKPSNTSPSQQPQQGRYHASDDSSLVGTFHRRYNRHHPNSGDGSRSKLKSPKLFSPRKERQPEPARQYSYGEYHPRGVSPREPVPLIPQESGSRSDAHVRFAGMESDQESRRSHESEETERNDKPSKSGVAEQVYREKALGRGGLPASRGEPQVSPGEVPDPLVTAPATSSPGPSQPDRSSSTVPPRHDHDAARGSVQTEQQTPYNAYMSGALGSVSEESGPPDEIRQPGLSNLPRLRSQDFERRSREQQQSRQFQGPTGHRPSRRLVGSQGMAGRYRNTNRGHPPINDFRQPQSSGGQGYGPAAGSGMIGGPAMGGGFATGGGYGMGWGFGMGGGPAMMGTLPMTRAADGTFGYIDSTGTWRQHGYNAMPRAADGTFGYIDATGTWRQHGTMPPRAADGTFGYIDSYGNWRQHGT